MIFRTLLIFLCIVTFYFNNSNSQSLSVKSLKLSENRYNENKFILSGKNPFSVNTLSTVSFGLMIVMMVVNPIVTYEDKRFDFGLTRELTLGFGKQGEYRVSAEYSYLFKDAYRHQLRISAKYDIMSHISRGDFISSRSVITFGAGYFIDGSGKGLFPEITAGYRIGESAIILYPYIKIRHTFMLTKDKPSITDFSCGAIFGCKLF